MNAAILGTIAGRLLAFAALIVAILALTLGGTWVTIALWYMVAVYSLNVCVWAATPKSPR